MAREHARIMTSIWSDTDFTDETPDEQLLYLKLLSQRNVSQAGVVPLQVRKWAKQSKHTTEEDVERALKALEAARFVVVDEDTEEVLIRSFVRNDGVLKVPNVFKAALRAATNVESPKLRAALAVELRRLRRRDADAVADELSPQPSGPDPEDRAPIPSDTEREPNATESERNREPVRTPSRTVDNRPSPVDNQASSNGSRTVRNGIPDHAGVGVGEGENSPSVGGFFGGSRAHAYTREAPAAPSRPPARCLKHLNHPDPPPCGRCADARRFAADWDAEQAAIRDRERAAIRACTHCDGDGWRWHPAGKHHGVLNIHCTHQADQLEAS